MYSIFLVFRSQLFLCFTFFRKMSLSARVLLQRCMSARLQTKPPSETKSEEFVEIGRGLLIYICFVKGNSDASGETGSTCEPSSDAFVDMIARRICHVKLCEGDNGKATSLMELPGDLLIIPQFTLGGKMKSKAFQYHNIINKEQCASLYHSFVSSCSKVLSESPVWKNNKCRVECGTYGNRQVLSTVTNGPFSHFVEF